MKGSSSRCRILVALLLLVLFVFSALTLTKAQGLPQLPAPGNPSNDCGCPRGDDGIPVSSGMLSPFLPKIPNLELGFLYYFGNRVSTGRFTADYVLPFRLSRDSVLFGEAHAEGWDFWKRSTVAVAAAPGFTVTTSPTNNRVDLSFGGGYRTMLGANTMLGVNGFYDTSRLFKKWYSSGGVGLEMAANVAGDDAIDLNFNWYGNLFNRDVLVNAFRNKGNSFDVEAGYSHALFNQALDLRLKLIGYQFDVGQAVQGWRGGADLTTRNGMFTLRYEYGNDRMEGPYNTVGGFVTVGFQLENLLSGESPFTLPKPVFKSPRDLRRLLGLKVKRNWHQPAAVTIARRSSSSSGCSLQGIIWLTASLHDHNFVLSPNPPLPVLNPADPGTVTIAWRGVQTIAAGSPVFTIVDGSNAFLAAPVPIAPGDGCAAVPLTRLGGIGPQQLIIYGYTFFGPPPPPDITFGPGGGISFSFP